MRKIAFICGPALGHVSRLLSIAESLSREGGTKITFITPDHGSHAFPLLKGKYDVIGVPVAKAALSLPAGEFGAGLEQHFASHGYDAIVQDLCPLRWMSAVRLPDCPRVVVTNFFLTARFGADTVQTDWFRTIRGQVNDWRRQRGLSAIQSAFELYEADRVLLADPPGLICGMAELPSAYRLCGPCAWTPDGDLPASVSELDRLLLVTLGSTGKRMFSAGVMEALKEWAGCGASLFAGGNGGDYLRKGIVDHAHPWLPLEPVLARSRLVVTQGGAGSTYMALAAGLPVIVLPGHRNHEIMGEVLQAAGCGLCGDPSDMAAELSRYSFDEMSAKAREIARPLAEIDGPGRAADEIVDLL
ncbi:MAG: hypothetical protein KDJ80_06980 [Nitratireductor sp.]|nr:hypothetical protein [Nitratireductor sp.]